MKTRVLLIIAFTAAVPPLAQAQSGRSPPAQSTWSTPPTPAKPSDSKALKPCPRYGEGFYQLPGSDTCVKMNGYLQSDVTVR